MNFVEKHSKLLAVALCLCAGGPILSTVHAYEVQPGWHTDGKTSYYVLDNHKRAKGLIEIDDAQYFFNVHGEMQHGWQNVENATYFFDNSGKAVTGKTEIQGTTYNFLSTGALASGWMEDGTFHNEKGFKVANQWVNDDSGKYYVNESGEPIKATWETIEGNDYYFDNQGRTAIGEVQSADGIFYSDDQGIVKTGFQPLEGATAYYNDNGAINMDNYKEIDEVTYAFNTDGTLLTNTERDGFIINESGAVLTVEGNIADISSVPVQPQPEVAPIDWVSQSAQEEQQPETPALEEVSTFELPVESGVGNVAEETPTQPEIEQPEADGANPSQEESQPAAIEEPVAQAPVSEETPAVQEEVPVAVAEPAQIQPEPVAEPTQEAPATSDETQPVENSELAGLPTNELAPIDQGQSNVVLEMGGEPSVELEQAPAPAPIAEPTPVVVEEIYIPEPETTPEEPLPAPVPEEITAPVVEDPNQGVPAPVAPLPAESYDPAPAPAVDPQPVAAPVSTKASIIYAAALGQLGVNQDCTALVTNSLAAAGVYFHGWPEEYACVGDWTGDPIPGDLVIYSGHVAVYAGNGMAVHGGWNGYTTALASINCSQALIGFIRVR